MDRAALEAIVGPAYLRTDPEARAAYGVDALQRGHAADAVVLPGSVAEIAALARLCHQTRTPLVPRGAGTGYTGGAVPIRGGVVLSLERLNRILEIDAASLLAVVEPAVVTGDLQRAVERVDLFYPPDPASLAESSIGGNVAECAGGPRAFKYGVTKHYVLGLEAVLPTGDVIRTGGRTVKNVVGYDLTQLLVGSEGTLAIITRITLRLIPKPPAVATLRATFATVRDAAAAVGRLVTERVVPAAIELVDRDSLEAVAQYLAEPTLAGPGTEAVLLIEVDGLPGDVAEQTDRAVRSCRAAGAVDVQCARTEAERDALWRVRRELSPGLRTISPIKVNHDVVVPKGLIPELFDLVGELRSHFGLRIPCFGHAGDGNIHVNIMAGEGDRSRAEAAAEALFRGVLALGGSISGEHGIGMSKARYLGLELSPETIATMRAVKQAFDPHGILNPGKIFAD